MIDTLTAGRTIKLIIINLKVSQTDIDSDIHPVADNPLITISKPPTIQLAFKPIVLQNTKRKVTEVEDTSRACTPR